MTTQDTSNTHEAREGGETCPRCDGEGTIHTGCDEAPVTQCGKCDGLGFVAAPAATSTKPAGETGEGPYPLALNVKHKLCHQAADAFWSYWNENGETHKRGYYESTWGAINQAIKLVGVVPWTYGDTVQAAAMQDKDIQALRALAEAATPGPWHKVDNESYFEINVPWPGHPGRIDKYCPSVCSVMYVNNHETPATANADYIAAANPAAILSLISRIEQAERQAKAARTVADQHFNDLLNAKASVDLSGLTRYETSVYHGAATMDDGPHGEWVKLSDVQALLSSPARDVGGLTDKAQVIALANASGIDTDTDGDIWGSTTGALFKFADALLATKASLTDEHIVHLHDCMFPRVELQREKIMGNVVQFARAIEREVLATKEAEPKLRELCAEMVKLHKERGTVLTIHMNALEDLLATSPAPSVKQEAINAEQIARKSRDLTLDYVAVHFANIIGVLNPDDVLDYLRSLKDAPLDVSAIVAAPSASHGEVKVPEGWQLVPKQMTVAMALALHGREGIEQGPGITCVSDETARLYDAMLSAAPAPSVTDGEKK